MRLLLIGNSDSPYLQELPSRLCSLGYEVDLLDDQKWHLVNCRGTTSKRTVLSHWNVSHIRYVRVFVRAARIARFLLAHQSRYCACQVHFVDPALGFLPLFFWSLIGATSTLSLFFWGSDLLRASRRARRLQRNLVRAAAQFVFNNPVVQGEFLRRFGARYRKKCRILRFPLPAFDELRTIVKRSNPIGSKRILGFPDNKFLLSVGYNGRPEQRHLLILGALKKMSPATRSRLFIVVPMTYGTNAQAEYVNEIERSLKDCDIPYRMILNRLDTRENARLRHATDILIHVQTTDSLSASMQEVLFCGGVVMNGSWLPYDELRALGSRWIDVDQVDDIAKLLPAVMCQYDSLRRGNQINRGIIERLSGWDELKGDWEQVLQELISVRRMVRIL